MHKKHHLPAAILVVLATFVVLGLLFLRMLIAEGEANSAWCGKAGGEWLERRYGREWLEPQCVKRNGKDYEVLGRP